MPEFDSMSQVDVTREDNSVSPLAPSGRREREQIFMLFNT